MPCRRVSLLCGMTVFIYGLYDPRNGYLRYIGKAIDLKARFYLHLSEKKNSHKNQWIAQLRSFGLLPEMRVLQTIYNSDDTDWQEIERWWIKCAREKGDPITNLDDGGRSGMKKSAETKEKMRLKQLGRIMSPESIAKMKATKAANLTPEVRERISKAQLGKRRTPEQRAAHSIALTGRVVSEETRRKIGEANKISREKYLALHPPKCRQPKIPKARQPISEETKAKQRAAKLGRTLSNEHRAALSAAQKLRWAQRNILQPNR